jgi:hypothetical protein
MLTGDCRSTTSTRSCRSRFNIGVEGFPGSTAAKRLRDKAGRRSACGTNRLSILANRGNREARL